MSDVERQLEAEDAAARAAALDIRASILLQAPAGSGKTTVLTQRYLKLLAAVEAPEQILAITFTRKATGELRTRVRKALLGDIELRSAADELTLELARVAVARHPNLVQQSHRLRVMTIDAWHMYLASRLPVSARSNVALQLADDAESLYRQAARDAIEFAEEDATHRGAVSLALDVVDNRWRKLEELLITMLAARNTWLPAIVRNRPEQLAAIVERTLTERIEATLQAAIGILGEARVSVGAELVAYGARVTRELGRVAPDGFEPWLSDTTPLTTRTSDLRRWRGIVKLAIKAEESPTIRSPKSANVSLGFAKEDKTAKARCQSWLADLTQVTDAAETLAAIRRLPVVPLDAATQEAMRALASLLLLAAQALDALFTERGECDYIAVAGAARQSLTVDGQPTDLAERLGTSVHHILVDEFQDTSQEQCALLAALTQDWSPGDGRSLFLVGDPMQSIYQFRNAEVGLFLAVRDHGIGPVRLKTLALRRNFRSDPALVNYANSVFARVFPRVDDSALAAVTHLASTPARVSENDGITTRICTYRVGPKQYAAEAEEVAARIATLRAQHADHSIAVLVGTRSHASHIVSALQQRGLAVSGVEFTQLIDTPVVRDLEALTRALLHLADRTAWLAVLRAPWAALSLADLTALVGDDAKATILERLQALDETTGLSPEGLRRARRVLDVMQRALAEQGSRTLAEWIESTWLKLDGPASAQTAAELANAEAFFNALSPLAESNDGELETKLDRALAKLYAPADLTNKQAIVITTIHQAKGLEFDHVILPGIGRKPRGDDGRLLEWLEFPWQGSEPRLLVAPSSIAGDPDAPLPKYIKSLRRERREFEAARLMYVAMTRAKRSMMLTVHPKPRKAPAERLQPMPSTSLEALWPAIQTEIDAWPELTNASSAGEQPPAHVVRRLASSYQRPCVPADAVRKPREIASLDEQPEYRWASETARHIGTVVHRALERIAKSQQLPPPESVQRDLPRLRAELAALGVRGAELTAAVQTARVALENTLADPRGQWILATSHREAHSELALSGLEGDRVVNAIIDRTFIDRDGVRWVVDFKTSPHEGGDLYFFLGEQLRRYSAQLQRYARLVRILGETRVRAGLYFPLLQAWREYPFE